MPEAVICEPVRTAVGRFGGVFADVPATALIEAAIRGLLERTGLPGERVNDVILGQCYPSGEAPAIGRVAALDAGLPLTVSGLQIDRRCGSGLMAVLYAAMQVSSGGSEVVIAGGVESMSRVEHYSTDLRRGRRFGELTLVDRLERARVTAGGRNYPVPGGMLETAENLRREYGISRAAQDELALESHQRAVLAQVEGRFDDEIVPVVVARAGGQSAITRDEHPRADISLDKLAELRPVRLGEDPDSTVTAGNASGQNDGAAVCIVTNPAWLPAPLIDRRDRLPRTPSTTTATHTARHALLATDRASGGDRTSLARLLLRSEAVASSAIEGVLAPADAVIAAEDLADQSSQPAAWIAANLAALESAITHASTARPLTVEDVHGWHHVLMDDHGRLTRDEVGRFRNTVCWIGGSNPHDAAFVATPPHAIGRLIDDLLAHLTNNSGDPIAQAAVGHAQFEVIHPYTDGNGRMGRLLIAWTLARRLRVQIIPALSMALREDIGGYLSGLTTYRTTHADAWVRWFANIVASTAVDARATATAFGRLRDAWTPRLDQRRSDAAARALAAYLLDHPVMTTAQAATRLHVDTNIAHAVLVSLAQDAIVTPAEASPNSDGQSVNAGQPQQRWIAHDLISLTAKRPASAIG
jgi:acetyl-CoA acetyltransferase family protein